MVGNEFRGGGGKPCNLVAEGLPIEQNSVVVPKSGYLQDVSTKQPQDREVSGMS